MSRETFERIFAAGGSQRTFCTLRRMGARPDEAEELAQLAWAHGWERREQLRDEARLVSWVIAAAVNEYRDSLRRRRFALQLDSLEAQIAPSVNLARIDLDRAFGRIPANQSFILRTVYLQQEDVNQVAADLRISKDALYHRLSRAKGALQRALNIAA